MKKIFIVLSLLVTVMAQAQSNSKIKLYYVGDGSLYVKEKTNLNGKLQIETGYSAPVASSGNLSLNWNIGYVQGVNDLWHATSFTTGLSFNYRLSKTWSAYTKTAANFRGGWTQETGFKTSIYRASNYSVTANAEYVFGYPFSHSVRPNWTVGLSVSFPLSK